MIIGGHEDKEDDKLILKTVAEQAASGRLVVAAASSEHRQELGGEYEQLFRGLGVRHVYKLPIESRDVGLGGKSVKILDDAALVFFAGGDQVKITSQMGCS